MTNTIIERKISSAFLLDKPKIFGIINIIDQMFKQQGITPLFSFLAKYKKGVTIKSNSLDKLLSFDNGIDNPMAVLEIEVNNLDNLQTKNMRTCIRYENTEKHNVVFRVEGTKLEAMLQLLAELDEPIKKTLLNGWIYNITKSKLLLAISVMIIILTAAGLVFSLLSSGLGFTRIPSGTAKTLLQKYSNAATQEEKVDFIFEYSMEQLKLEERQDAPREINLSDLLNFETFFLVLPILLVMGILIYILIKCYPPANFLWGEYEERYAHLISSRTALWELVFGSLILGVVSNFFVIGLSSYLKLGR